MWIVPDAQRADFAGLPALSPWGIPQVNLIGTSMLQHPSALVSLLVWRLQGCIHLLFPNCTQSVRCCTCCCIHAHLVDRQAHVYACTWKGKGVGEGMYSLCPWIVCFAVPVRRQDFHHPGRDFCFGSCAGGRVGVH